MWSATQTLLYLKSQTTADPREWTISHWRKTCPSRIKVKRLRMRRKSCSSRMDSKNVLKKKVQKSWGTSTSGMKYINLMLYAKRSRWSSFNLNSTSLTQDSSPVTFFKLTIHQSQSQKILKEHFKDVFLFHPFICSANYRRVLKTYLSSGPAVPTLHRKKIQTTVQVELNDSHYLLYMFTSTNNSSWSLH